MRVGIADDSDDGAAPLAEPAHSGDLPVRRGAELGLRSVLDVRSLDELVLVDRLDGSGAGAVRGARERTDEGRVLDVPLDVDFLPRADVRAHLDDQPGIGLEPVVTSHRENNTW